MDGKKKKTKNVRVIDTDHVSDSLEAMCGDDNPSDVEVGKKGEDEETDDSDEEINANDQSEESDTEELTSSPASWKGQIARRKVTADEYEGGFEGEETPSPPIRAKKTVWKKKLVVDEISDEDFEEEETPLERYASSPGRGKKTAQGKLPNMNTSKTKRRMNFDPLTSHCREQILKKSKKSVPKPTSNARSKQQVGKVTPEKSRYMPARNKRAE